MKLPLVNTGILLTIAAFTAFTAMASIGCRPATKNENEASSRSMASSQFVMRAERTLRRDPGDRRDPIRSPEEDIAESSYAPIDHPEDRWNVSIDGPNVVLTSIGPTGKAKAGGDHLEGKELLPAVSNIVSQRRFDITKGLFAGGRFVVRGDEAELTVYGSGVPIISSERGKLVPAK